MTLELTSAYYIAWAVYLGAVLLAQLLVWRAVRLLQWVDLQIVIHVIIFGLLITPARLEPGQDYWVPAAMVALMDFINGETEAALNNMAIIFTVIFVLLLISIVSRWIRIFLLKRATNNAS